MSKSAIEVIARACKRVGLTAPGVAFGSTDKKIVQMVELLNAEGQELSGEFAWEMLTFEQSFTTAATESQGEVDGTIIPAGKNYRYILNDTLYNRDTLVPIYGPKAANAWQRQKSYNLVGPWPTYRIRGGEMIMDPVPVAGQDVYFEYVSANWVESQDGIDEREEVGADTDVFRLDWKILVNGVVWRWKRAKGLDYSQEFDSYTRMVQDAKGRDGTNPVKSLDGSEQGGMGYVVPIGSWNL